MVKLDLSVNYKPISKINDISYSICWGNTPADDMEGYSTWNELILQIPYKPALYEIQNAIIENINTKTNYDIENSFSWHGLTITLTKETQMNITALYIASVNSAEKILPIVYKFKKDSTSVYYTFNNVEDITDLYIEMVKFINSKLVTCWKEKEAIDWSLYQ